MAQRTEIAAEIEALSVHCRPPIMEVDQRASWTRDWCNDLGEYPIEAIREACRKWRQGGQSRFPTPGQLLPMIRAELPQPECPGANGPWKPLSDEAYAALNLPAKIRHRRVLAGEARTDAARQAHKLGWDRNVQTAPPIYRDLMAKAQAHDDEAKRLSSHMRYGLAAE